MLLFAGDAVEDATIHPQTRIPDELHQSCVINGAPHRSLHLLRWRLFNRVEENRSAHCYMILFCSVLPSGRSCGFRGGKKRYGGGDGRDIPFTHPFLFIKDNEGQLRQDDGKDEGEKEVLEKSFCYYSSAFGPRRLSLNCFWAAR